VFWLERSVRSKDNMCGKVVTYGASQGKFRKCGGLYASWRV